MLSYVKICRHISSCIIIYTNVFPTKSPTHIYIQTMWLLQPRFPQSSGTRGCRVGWRSLGEQRHRSLGWGCILNHVLSCFLFFVFSVFIFVLFVTACYLLFVNCIMFRWFRWKEFDESSGHGHSAVHVIHSATPRTRRLRGEIWFSKTFVRCDAGNWAFKASFSSQRGVVWGSGGLNAIWQKKALPTGMNF